ncbi:Alpha/beta hydrolase fold-3, partial [Mycotypha africana]|uniref:Alpha/beta hydrolase fold-3 n=1 Tax=Mycotypha africana TaxID=64632 RepID=UPI00230135FE
DREDMSIFCNGKMVNLTIYRPPCSHNDTLPALIYLHGGGWILEVDEAYDYICPKIAVEAGCAVFYVHYSLAPEGPFPTAVEECYSTYAWLANPANAFLKVDPARIAVAGDSAGGNLAIALCLLAQQRELEHKPKFQALFYPVTNDQLNTSSYFEFSKEYPLNRRLMEWFWDLYVPGKDNEERKNPLACPLKATKEQLQTLPPTLLVTAEADVLRDEGEEFARKLLDAGVKVNCMRVLGTLHGFVSSA